MSPQLTKFLGAAYQQYVLGQKVDSSAAWQTDDIFIADAKKELARIKSLGGINLQQRDFASWFARQAIERELAKMEAKTEQQRAAS